MNCIDVGIVNYNSGNCLSSCIESLLNMKGVNVNVFVFDNNSIDASLQIAEEKFPQCKYYKSKVNLGYAGGCNHLIKEFTSEIVAVCNMDLVFDPEWALNIIRDFNDHPDVDSLSSSVIQSENNEVYATDIHFFWDLHPMCVAEQCESGQFRKVFGAYGAVMAFRKRLFSQIGFFEEDYFLFFEETEFFLRMNINNKFVGISPDAKVFHHRSVATIKYSPMKLYYSERNRIFTVLKYLPLWYIPFVFPLSLIRMYIMMKNGVPQNDGAGKKINKVQIGITLLKAWFSALLKIPREWKKRRNLWKESPYNPVETLRIIRRYCLNVNQLRVR